MKIELDKITDIEFFPVKEWHVYISGGKIDGKELEEHELEQINELHKEWVAINYEEQKNKKNDNRLRTQSKSIDYS